MITKIYFVRHAHSIFSLEEEETRELSKKGWEDAEKVTNILLGENIDVIVASTYTRAKQTVEVLSSILEKDIELDSRFRERDLAARDYIFENPLKAMKLVFENPTHKFPGGESNKEVQERGISGLKDIVHRYGGKNIVIGIHGNIMTCTMNYFNRKYDFDFWKETTKPDIYKLSIDEDFQLVACTRLWKNDTL